MKKILLLLCMVFLCTCVFGCKQKEEIPDATYNDAISAISIFDKYWNDDISKAEAEERLYELSDNTHSDEIENMVQASTAVLIESQISSLHTYVMLGDDSSALEIRNELAEEVGTKMLER